MHMKMPIIGHNLSAQDQLHSVRHGIPCTAYLDVPQRARDLQEKVSPASSLGIGTR